jgi:hypothetical protein
MALRLHTFVALSLTLACGGLGGPGLKTSGGGGGVTTVSAVGSSANANGATVSGVTINLEPASGSFPGVVTTGTQTFAGNKTFSGTVALGSSGTIATDPAFKANGTGIPSTAWIYNNDPQTYTHSFVIRPGTITATTFTILPAGSFGASNCTGTGTFAGSADADAYWLTTTSGANDNDGSQQINSTAVAYDYMARLIFVVKAASDITAVRYWADVNSNASTTCNNDSAAAAKVGFRYSTDASDTTWQACTSDGATQSCTDTTVTVVADTAYILEMRKNGSAFDFYVNGVLKVHKTTNVPSGTSALNLAMSVSALSASARTLKARLVYGEHF